MKKVILLVLVFAFCISLCACGGSDTVASQKTDMVANTEESIAVVQEKVVTVHAQVPDDWENPGCWTWSSDGRDAFEAWPGEEMTKTGDWYTVETPDWVDYVIINGNGGTVQTADCQIQPGKDIWVVVNQLGDAKIYYQEPEPLSPEEIFAAVQSGAGEDGITDTKAITVVYEEKSSEELSRKVYLDYLPAEEAAKAPEEVSYIVNLRYRATPNNYYFGTVKVYNCSIIAEIVDAVTGEIIQKETFRGKGLPDHIVTDKTQYYEEYPDEGPVLEWVMDELNAARGQKTAEIMDVAGRILGSGRSYANLQEMLVEYYSFTPAQARYAADNCGADWYQEAVISAQSWVERGDGYSPQQLIENLRDISGFTDDQAVYGMENCGADWQQEALKVAKYFLEVGMGYSHSSMIGVLVNDYGFMEAQAIYAADNCNADWNQVAVDHVMLFLEYSEESYTRDQMIQEMVDYFGFTQEQAVYACDKVGLK